LLPFLILAFPDFDTLYAIIRYAKYNHSIMHADNKHSHYQLILVVFSHRQSIIIIYFFSAMFGLLAIVFARASMYISLLVTFIAFILVHILAEFAGLVAGGKRPLVDMILRALGVKKIRPKAKEEE